MNLEQWKIELNNNLQSIIDECSRLKNHSIGKPDIDRIKDKVNALQDMYDNISIVTP